MTGKPLGAFFHCHLAQLVLEDDLIRGSRLFVERFWAFCLSHRFVRMVLRRGGGVPPRPCGSGLNLRIARNIFNHTGNYWIFSLALTPKGVSTVVSVLAKVVE